MAQRGLELLDVKAHRAIADDAHDLGVGLCDLAREGLRHASAQHPELEGR